MTKEQRPEDIKEEKAKEYALSFFKTEELSQYDLEGIDEIERDFKAGFEAGKQEERNSKWISVKEKPEYDGYYLCSILYPQECGNIWKRQEVVYLHFNAWQLNDRSGTITHWQKLPEPPIENLSK